MQTSSSSALTQHRYTQQLEAGRGARAATLNADELLQIKNLGLLTLKPLIYAANVGEDDLGNQGANNVHVQVRVALCACACQRRRQPRTPCMCALLCLLSYSFIPPRRCARRLQRRALRWWSSAPR